MSPEHPASPSEPLSTETPSTRQRLHFADDGVGPATPSFRLVLAGLAMIAGPFFGQPSPEDGNGSDARTLFAQQAPLTAPGADAGDLVRLPLGSEVLRACRADLSDLRLFSGTRTLPFVLRRSTEARRILREPAVIRSAERSATASAAGGTATPAQTEAYLLDAPSAWSSNGDWNLRVFVDAGRSSFARDVELGWTDGDTFEAQLRSTVFRLRNGAAMDEVELPPRTGRRLGVRLLGQDTAETLAPLEPRFVFQRAQDAAETSSDLDVELDLGRPVPADGEFVVETHLAPGLLADRLRFESATRTLRRRVTVIEIGPDGSEQLLGQGWLQRVESAPGSMVVNLATNARAISPTDGVRRLRIAIDGGDSPPLEELAVFAQLTQPELVFEWPAESNVELLFGGGRARLPRFDLQQAADRRQFVEESSDQTWSLLTEADLPTATRGAIEANPSFDDQPLLAFLQRPGRALTLDAFQWTASLDLPEEPSGLYRVALTPPALSRIDADFADLRFLAAPADIASDEGSELAQWPFLVAPADDWSLDLMVEATQEAADRTSRIELRIPEHIGAVQRDGALRPRSLELTFDQPFFDRHLRLLAVTDGGSRPLLERRVTTGRAREAFFSRRTTSQATLDVSAWLQGGDDIVALRLEIEDGDDAPSEVRSARLSGPGSQALLVATPGPVRAVFGATGVADLERPTYELQRARSLLQSLRGREVALGQATPNTEAARPGLLDRLTGDWQSILLWVAILLAVLALGWITLRSVRS